MSPQVQVAKVSPDGGESGALIERLEAALQEYSEREPGAAAMADIDTVEGIGDDLTDLLRWEKRYREAIALQTRLATLLPDQSQRFRITAAILVVEAGATEQGLRYLKHETAYMEPAEGNLLMASTLTWLQQYEAAEQLLNDVVSDGAASPTDRATAYYSLFQVLNLLQKLPKAVAAWDAAVALDPGYSDTLPELVRAQIYWRDFAGASTSTAGDRSEIRRSFYRDLIKTRTTPGAGRALWDWVNAYDTASIGEAHEEFAEAALRNVSPRRALEVLVPFVERQDLSRQRLVLTGLGWAQERQVERAQWALQLALRLAEIERPRRTRQGAGSARIFDAETRIAYGEIPIDDDVRTYLDHFFMPKSPVAFHLRQVDEHSAA